MSDHTFVAGSVRDLNKPVPRIALTGWRTRVPMPRPGLTFPVLLVAGGVWGLVVEAGNGWSSTVTRFGAHAPLGVVWGIAVLVGIALFVQRARNPRPSWYRWWSLLDSWEEPGGVRLVSNRVRADDPGVTVRPGDHVEVHATLIARRGAERTYRFRVHAPGGELTFDVPIFVEKLSMAPLDELAARWGFTVTVHDDAQRIRRADVGGISTR
jgi:hypothetical protein